MRSWDKFLKEKIEILAKCNVVYDIGGGAAPRDRKHFHKYVLVDVDETYKPDIIADIQKLPFNDNSTPGIICLSVLEHVENPFKAADEMHRVLEDGGVALISVPFIWPYHGNPHYKDYWRFSKDGVKVLFKNFSKIEVVQAGGYFSVLTNLIPAYLKIDQFLRPFAEYIDDRFKFGRRNNTEFFVFLTK